MKTRNGFISNSSSSSFVMIGFTVESGDIEKLFIEAQENEEFNFEKALEEIGLDLISENNDMYIGVYMMYDPDDYVIHSFSINKFYTDKIKELELTLDRKAEIIFGPNCCP